jgi:hypothetical protein
MSDSDISVLVRTALSCYLTRKVVIDDPTEIIGSVRDTWQRPARQTRFAQAGNAIGFLVAQLATAQL